MPVETYALHGFLGRPADWDFLKGSTPGLRAPDLYRVLSPATGGSPWAWARAFNQLHGRERDRSTRVLLGYSMGGRLALHALLDDPSLWDAAVIVSANPGLLEESRRTARIAADEAWAIRFERDPWESVVRAWDAQEVFGGSFSRPERGENEHRREDLAGSLRAWSLGRQDPLLERLTALPLPLFWIAGERDAPYREIASRITRLRKTHGTPGELWIAPGAAHRVPWEVPEEFRRQLGAFIHNGFQI